MTSLSVYFYGKFASSSRRDLERLARERGWKVASALRPELDCVVLGEGESLARARARLADEFDDLSRDAFVKGSLELVSESQFIARLSGADGDDAKLESTPAAAAELVGVDVADVRRWLRRGFLKATCAPNRPPLLTIRELLVAKRLAFLLSSGLSEDLLATRVVAFAARERENDLEERTKFDKANFRRNAVYSPKLEQTNSKQTLFPFADAARKKLPKFDDSLARDLTRAPFDVGAVILRLTLASGGRDALDAAANSDAPVDARGQRRFLFDAAPIDGAFDPPPAPPPLSDQEQQVALAERLREWNRAQTSASGKPAFLSLFLSEDGAASAFGAPPRDADEFARFEERASTIPNAFALAKEKRESWRRAANRRLVEMCEEGWNLEREGYWEEAARAYRAAALAGGPEPGICCRLGRILFLLGDYAAARERFFAALELDEDFTDARIGLGRSFAALGALDDALAAFQGALEDRPDDPTTLVELAKLRVSRGEREAAQDALRRAEPNLSSDPQLFEAARKLALAIALNEI